MPQSWIAGVGMIPFVKAGTSPTFDLMASNATRIALDDAGLDYQQVERAYASYILGESGGGQEALYHVGLTGIPVINVQNACASGSTALMLAREAVESGVADIVLAVGFEQMLAGPILSAYTDRPLCAGLKETSRRIQGYDDAQAIATQVFGGAGNELIAKYGYTLDTFAKISVKSRQHASNNPYALFRTPTTVEEVLASKHVYGPLTRFQCSPPTSGAAAVIVVSDRFKRRAGLSKAVRILGQALTTDNASSFADSLIDAVGADMSRRAAQQVFETAGIGPEDLDVVELHDCFTSNELISYEALQLCRPGGAEEMVQNGDNTYGGKVVVNPSGGLISKGHPIGATGLAQIAELTWHLRGQAGPRQVEGARFALQHNVGLGGACVVTLLSK